MTKIKEAYLVTHLMENENFPEGVYAMPVFSTKELAESYIENAITDDKLELVLLNRVDYIKS